jgi:hypothetical protein
MTPSNSGYGILGLPITNLGAGTNLWAGTSLGAGTKLGAGKG